MMELRKKLLVAGIAGAFVVAALPAGASKPKLVWEDPSGDADLQQGLGQSLPGGFDITEGAIARDKKNLVFTVVHADMTDAGAIPEGFRFMWAFMVDGTEYRITAKSADVGKPNPVNQEYQDRIGQVSVGGFFRIDGECGTQTVGTVSFIDCKGIGYPEGSFDAASQTLTVTVPMEMIGAKNGSVITGAGGDAASICQICWVSHAAERSSDRTIVDGAVQTVTYKVPKK